MWYNQEWEDIARMKLGFLTSRRTGFSTPLYGPLEKTWIPSLCLIFMRGFSAKANHDTNFILGELDDTEDFDDTTLGGHISYDKFMDILYRKYP